MRIQPLLLLVCFFISCQSKEKSDALVSNMDTTVRASKDVFLYANGGWLKKKPIASDESGWGIAHLATEENLARLKIINEKAVLANETETKKNGEFWKNAIDSAAVKK